MAYKVIGGKLGDGGHVEKECPLHFSMTPLVAYMCTREQCEWWLPEKNECAVTVLARK